MFEYIYEKICRWRIQKSKENANFRAMYPKNGTMYILASHQDGSMDTQMSQDSFGIEHENRGEMIAVLQQPFTTQENLRKNEAQEHKRKNIATNFKVSRSEEAQLSDDTDTNEQSQFTEADTTVESEDDNYGSHNALALQHNVKSSKFTRAKRDEGAKSHCFGQSHTGNSTTPSKDKKEGNYSNFHITFVSLSRVFTELRLNIKSHDNVDYNKFT